MSIWKDLISQLTLSGYYEQKCGTLSVKPDIDELRLWKEYFNNLVTKSKDHYGLSLIAEDNSDYVNL